MSDPALNTEEEIVRFRLQARLEDEENRIGSPGYVPRRRERSNSATYVNYLRYIHAEQAERNLLTTPAEFLQKLDDGSLKTEAAIVAAFERSSIEVIKNGKETTVTMRGGKYLEMITTEQERRRGLQEAAQPSPGSEKA